MNCKEIQELLLTDYADGEASADTRGIVTSHLAACGKCRSFEAALRKSALEPFENTRRAVPPPEIWYNIQAELAGEAPLEAESLYTRVRCFLDDIFPVRRPFVAVTAAVAAVLAAVIITLSPSGRPDGLSDFFEEQAEFFIYPDQDGESSDYPNFGTGIEEYFL